jgi:Holliday junction resolvase RusA-like endonuclease
MRLTFSIPGTPVAKGRPKFARRGAFISTYTDSKTASYENLVKVKAEEAMDGRDMIIGAAAVKLFLFVAPPASWSQKKQRSALAGELHPTSKPDIDNVAKGVLDACNGIVWADDKQVVQLEAIKRYAALPGAVIEVETL